MDKKLYKLLSILGLILIIFTFYSCGSIYRYKEGHFIIELTVSKTDVVVGEEIEVTTVLKNVSGKKRKILMFDGCWTSLDKMIQIHCVPRGKEVYFWSHDDIPRIILVFEKNQTVIKTERFIIEEAIDYEIFAQAIFFYGYGAGGKLRKNYGDSGTVRSNSVFITPNNLNNSE